MIKKKCFKNNWITNKYQEMDIDPILIEKALYAFELLGNLIENDINLIDQEEYIKIISNIVLNCRINMAEVLDYADRREAKELVWHIIKNCIKLTNASF